MLRVLFTLPVLIAAMAALLVAAIGGAVTLLGPWYEALAKPSWQPPGSAFGIAWTAIFAACAASGAIAWRKLSGQHGAQSKLLVLFAVNAALNIGWSLLFFRLQRPDWAFAEMALLWISIAHLIWFVRSNSAISAWLLAPYLAWVTFAAALNAEIVRLNGPFGGGL